MSWSRIGAVDEGVAMRRTGALVVLLVLMLGLLSGCASSPAAEEPEAELSDAEALAQGFVLAVEQDDETAFNDYLDVAGATHDAYEWVLSGTPVEHVDGDTRKEFKAEIEALLTPQGFATFLSSDTSMSVEQTSSALAYALCESPDGDVTLELAVVRGTWRVVGIDTWEFFFTEAFHADWVAVLEADDARWKAESQAQQAAEVEAERQAAKDARAAIAAQAVEAAKVGGLTLAERKQVAWELAEKEDKAMVDAEMRYPTNLVNGGSMDNVMPNAEYWSELSEKYQAEVRKKWGITYDEMLDIIVEATENDWPLPEPPDMSQLP